MKKTGSLEEQLASLRNLELMPVVLPGGVQLTLTPGAHNELQKAVIDLFLPRYGFDAEVLYLGDASNKRLHVNEARLRELNLFELEHGELPDVIAYSRGKNWIYLIEAVHSFGPISPIRRRTLAELAANATAPVVYVSAFKDRSAYRKFASELAWEQEVWMSDEPDHMIHLNGDKFLGPYSPHRSK